MNPILDPPEPLLATLAGFRDPTTVIRSPVNANNSFLLVEKNPSPLMRIHPHT